MKIMRIFSCRFQYIVFSELSRECPVGVFGNHEMFGHVMELFVADGSFSSGNATPYHRKWRSAYMKPAGVWLVFGEPVFFKREYDTPCIFSAYRDDILCRYTESIGRSEK